MVSTLELSVTSGALAHFEVLARLVLAIALAGVLGWDREKKNRPAGLRTYMLVALAASVFTVLTFEIFDTVSQRGGDSNADPIRIIEAVTAGVAFLAAGTIIHGKGTVRGLTTGAGMWMAGALGVAAGTGQYFLAIMAAALSFAILRLLALLQDHEAALSDDAKPATLTLVEEDEEDRGNR